MQHNLGSLTGLPVSYKISLLCGEQQVQKPLSEKAIKKSSNNETVTIKCTCKTSELSLRMMEIGILNIHCLFSLQSSLAGETKPSKIPT